MSAIPLVDHEGKVYAVLSVYSTYEDGPTAECCCIELSPAFFAEVRRRLESARMLFERDTSAREVSWWGANVEWRAAVADASPLDEDAGIFQPDWSEDAAARTINERMYITSGLTPAPFRHVGFNARSHYCSETFDSYVDAEEFTLLEAAYTRTLEARTA